MPKQWDRLVKTLLAANPQHLVSWLLPGALYKGELVREQFSRSIEADILYNVAVQDKQDMVLHVEIQRSSDSGMVLDARLWKR